MQLKQQIRRGLLEFLKKYINPLTLKLARGQRGSFAIVQHTGRRSGKAYETPIIVQPGAGGYVFELTYGPQVDWFQNVLAAGGCTLVRHGEVYDIVRIEPLDVGTGRAAFPQPQHFILKTLGMKYFYVMKTA